MEQNIFQIIRDVQHLNLFIKPQGFKMHNVIIFVLFAIHEHQKLSTIVLYNILIIIIYLTYFWHRESVK